MTETCDPKFSCEIMDFRTPDKTIHINAVLVSEISQLLATKTQGIPCTAALLVRIIIRVGR